MDVNHATRIPPKVKALMLAGDTSGLLEMSRGSDSLSDRAEALMAIILMSDEAERSEVSAVLIDRRVNGVGTKICESLTIPVPNLNDRRKHSLIVIRGV